LSVLVVEDHRDPANVLAKLHRSDGYGVITAHSCADAVTAAVGVPALELRSPVNEPGKG
jgi:DNA-binding response OmpR family regulator